MKKILLLALCALFGLSLAGCKSEMTVGKDIKEKDVTDFYWTVENINYNAFYQRYRFFVEDGKPTFFHETRQRKDDYGPTTEADTIKTGTFELTQEEWDEFFGYLEGGTVRERGSSAETGSSGPWTYLYWSKDKGKIQEFEFSDYGVRASFEEFCEGLADQER